MLTAQQRMAETLRLAASISRLHIVVIAGLGAFTFGWVLTGRHLWLVSMVGMLDWFLVNLLNRVVDHREDEANAITGAALVSRHRRSITAAGLLALAASLLLHLCAPAVTGFRLGYHLLGLSYNWPLLPGRRRIKQLYFFKNTASAVGFLLTVFCYPLAAARVDGQPVLATGVSWVTVGVAAVFFALFELSYEVIYDLRDVEGDKLAGVQTYPVVHGQAAAVRIVDGLIAASMLVLVGGYVAGAVPWRLLIMVCAPLLQLVLYKLALRRGIKSGDCIGLTWLGAALLATYHIWIALGLPGSELP